MTAPQVPGFAPVTYTEGDEAFLRGPEGLVKVPAAIAEQYIAQDGYLPATAEQVAERKEQKKYEGVAGGAVAAAERLGMGAVDALTALPRGAAALGYAATGSETLRDFVDETSTDKFFRNIAYINGGREGEKQFERAQRAQAAEWPTLTALSRGLGQGAGALASGGAGLATKGVGLAGQAARLGAAGAAEGLAFGVTSPFDTLETVPNTAATREAVLSNGLIGAVLGFAGGAGGAVASKGAGAAAEKLRAVFAKPAIEAASEAVDGSAAKALTSVADSPEARITAAWEGLTEDVAKVADQAGPNPVAMKQAADAAAVQTTSRLEQIAGKITPETWDKVELNDLGKYIHRDTLLEGATKSVTRDLDEVLSVSREATKELREAPLKRELVARNLAESEIDETAAIASGQQRIAELRSKLQSFAGDPIDSVNERGVWGIRQSDADMRPMDGLNAAYKGADREMAEAIATGKAPPVGSVTGQPLPPVTVAVYPDQMVLRDGHHRLLAARTAKAKNIRANVVRYNAAGDIIGESEELLSIMPSRARRGGQFADSARTIRSLESTLSKAQKRLETVDNAADAYITLDQARRELYKLVPGLKNQSQNSMAHLSDQGRQLLEFVETEYRGLADSLFDDKTWGKQGLAQASVNKSWVGAIDADKVGVRNFTGTGSFDIYNRPELIADPDKIRGYLDKLGDASLRDREFRRILDTQEQLAKAMEEGYDLSPATREKLKRSVAATQRMKTTLERAERIVAEANAQRKTLDAEKAMAVGRIGNIATGFASDGLRGAIAGALFPGGRAGAVQMVKNLKDISDGNRGMLAEAMAKAAESVMGSAPKSKEAVTKAAKTVRSTGLLSPRSERTAKRVRDGLLASTPAIRSLLENTRDMPRAEQRKKYEERRDVLAQLISNPSAMTAAISKAVAPIQSAHPELGGSLMLDVVQRLNALHAAMPGKRELSMIPSRARDVVSDADLRTAEALIEATVDPMSVFTDFQKGVLNPEKLAFARQQWPEMFQQAQAALMDILPRLEDDVTDEALAQLDSLLGMGGSLDQTQRPDFLARSMERGKLAAADAAAQDAQRASAGGGSAAQTAKRHQTYTNRLMGAT